MLMQGQQVEMCYMGIEDSKNAFKKTMDFIANPISSSAGLIVSFVWHILPYITVQPIQ